ncbi:MAG: hypothetical protein FWD79_10725 [Desulfobulbus sp.]|nr:hypothetical protein [Desulfobulbus sp.]
MPPECGGTDRFHIWPNQAGGETAQRAGVSGTFWCRQCDAGGDVIDLLKFSEGLDYKTACKELYIEMEKPGHRLRPIRQPKRESSTWTPTQWKIPAEKWRIQATKLALGAHERLLVNTSILSYLAGRGLPQEVVARYRLGYLEGEDKKGVCLYRARSAFDLPEKKSEEKSHAALWIPRGLTIPLWCGDEVHRIRIRRRKDDLRERDSKYILLEGSGQAPMVLPPEGVRPGLTAWVVVESELDACAVHHACSWQIGVLASLTNVGKPDAAAHRLLSQAKLILVALDFDTPDAKGKRAGYHGWIWWRDHYAVARRWPVPKGKDPGEAFGLGVDLAAWVQAAMPELGTMGKSDSAAAALGEGAAPSATPASAQVPAGNRWVKAGADTPLADAVYPEEFGYSTEHLRAYYAGKSADDDDVLMVCPKTAAGWGWRSRLWCRTCKGHRHCLAEFLLSPQMLAPMETEHV